MVVSCVDVAVIVAVPVAAGVKTPALLTVPILVGLTDQATDVLKLPVPETLAVQVDVCEDRMEVGEQDTDTDVIVDPAVTVTVAEPNLVVSCVDVAVIVAVPVATGVKTPALLTVPIFVGLTDHVTAELKLPVPVTLAVHAEVCVVRIAVGTHATETDVIVDGRVTVMIAEPNLVVSCVDVAVMVAVPAPAGVKTPAPLTVPMLVGLTDQVTVEL
ncbi:MAG TPA: hypothetical protein VGT08_18860 [Terracidiphilus sp.]|nr:hypothetical protein [Terracidiphilus sp.]